MRTRVIAIGMDGADPVLVEQWMDAGLLPGLAALRREGAWGRLTGLGHHRAELAWTTLLTGCEPERTGYWSPLVFTADGYGVHDQGAYDFAEHPPFYALGDERRVVVVDVPQTLARNDVDGLQLLAWGSHSPQGPSCSVPPELFGDLVRRHGRHPALHRDHATHWNPVAVARLRRALRLGIRRRVAICRELLAREPWDLFMTTFGETHSASHFLWHLSDETGHPVQRGRAEDALLEVFQAVDAAVHEIVQDAGDATVVVFSPQGMESNSMDLPSLVFLPELCYRLSFPGREALAPGGSGSPPPVLRNPRALAWHRWLWRSRRVDGRLRSVAKRALPLRLARWSDEDLQPPYAFGPLFYEPALWYSALWPRMRAFALPSFSEGYVRINLMGREASGIVPQGEYEAVCHELEEHLHQLRDARTGRPVVREVVRTRNGPGRDDPRLPDADLIVCWASDPVDVVDSPTVGRMGPVPFGRTGSHLNRGFVAVRGPAVAAGSRLPDGKVIDVAPTVLDLVGAAPPMALDGRSLLAPAPSV